MTVVRSVPSRFLAILVIVLIGACSRAPAATSTAVVAVPSVVEPSSGATGSPVPTAEPIASAAGATVRDGEPWVLSAWYLPGKNTKNLFLTRPDGTDQHAILTDLPGEHVAPAWAPDGRSFAFVVRDAATPLGSIWTADPDGSEPAMLTDGGGDCPDGIFHPNWSPDGSTLAVICYPDPNGKQGSVATFDPVTRKVTRLATVAWPEHVDGAPAWSPDGMSLAFAILHWDPTDQFLDGSLVAVMPAAGGPVRRLTTLDTSMSGPAWSPDGSELAMFSNDLGNMHTTDQPSNVYAIRPDGTGQRQITKSSVDGHMRITSPRWTPDGARMMVTIGIAPPGVGPTATVNDLRLAFVDAAGGEPVLAAPTLHGGALRPTP